MLKVDFHSHTNYIQKYETSYSPKELIDRAASLGFDAFCISEHYALTKLGDLFKEYRKYPFASYELVKDYAKEKGILLIRSVEVRYPEGEVLLINFHGDLKDYPTLKSLKNLPKTVLVIAPHPYFKRGFCLDKNLEKNIRLFDAIEYCHNYINALNLNKKAVEIGKKYKKPIVGTSDVHHLFQVGITYTLVDADKTTESIVKAVKAGKVKLMSKPLPFHLFAFITLGSVWKTSLAGIRIAYRKLLKK
jgi:predicted metal-dependent phosphoesterase TrpH